MVQGRRNSGSVTNLVTITFECLRHIYFEQSANGRCWDARGCLTEKVLVASRARGHQGPYSMGSRGWACRVLPPGFPSRYAAQPFEPSLLETFYLGVLLPTSQGDRVLALIFLGHLGVSPHAWQLGLNFLTYSRTALAAGEGDPVNFRQELFCLASLELWGSKDADTVRVQGTGAACWEMKNVRCEERRLGYQTGSQN